MIDGMGPILAMVAVYMVIIGLFAYYAYLNVRQTNAIEQWNMKTDIEIDANRERIVELEKRLKHLEHELGGTGADSGNVEVRP